MLLPYEVEWALARVLNEELKNSRNQAYFIETLVNASDWDYNQIFDFVNDRKPWSS
jgi:hypothetical protein